MAQWAQKVWIKIHKSFWNTAVPYPPPLGAPLGPFDFEIHVSVPLRHPESTGVATLSSSLPSLRRVVNKGWGLQFKNFRMCCLLTFAHKEATNCKKHWGRHASFISQQITVNVGLPHCGFEVRVRDGSARLAIEKKLWCLKNLQKLEA